MHPHHKRGKFDGLVFDRLDEAGMWKGVGVRTGDVLHAFNGDKFDTPNKALQVLELVKKGGELASRPR